MKRNFVLGLGLALAATAASAQDWGFEDFDTDTDGYIDEAEFGAGVEEADLFGKYDVDDDSVVAITEWPDPGIDQELAAWGGERGGALPEDDFARVLLLTWDEDEDGVLSEAEWAAAEEDGWFE